MSPKDEKHLRRILREAGIKDSDYTNADWWLKEYQEYGTPVLQKALFLREVWAPILRKADISWIDKTIADLNSRQGRCGAYADRFLPEMPDVLSALNRAKESGLDPKDLSVIVREAQLSVLSWIISILDGGHCFSDGLDSNWALCSLDKECNPEESFGNMQELLWDFDPDRERDA